MVHIVLVTLNIDLKLIYRHRPYDSIYTATAASSTVYMRCSAFYYSSIYSVDMYAYTYTYS